MAYLFFLSVGFGSYIFPFVIFLGYSSLFFACGYTEQYRNSFVTPISLASVCLGRVFRIPLGLFYSRLYVVGCRMRGLGWLEGIMGGAKGDGWAHHAWDSGMGDIISVLGFFLSLFLSFSLYLIYLICLIFDVFFP